MPIRLGIDCNGVVFDLAGQKQQWIKTKFGIDVLRSETVKNKAAALLGEETYKMMIVEINSDEWVTQKEVMPKAVSVLNYLKENKCELYFVVSHTEGETNLIKNLIVKNKIPYDGIYNTKNGSKGDLCRGLGLDLFVDDTQTKLVEISKISVGTKLVFFNSFKEHVSKGITEVYSWEDLERYLSKRYRFFLK